MIRLTMMSLTMRKSKSKRKPQTTGTPLFEVGDETVRVPMDTALSFARKLGYPIPKHIYVPPDDDSPYTPLSADEWQRFKRDFVKEYGEEPVQPTGMTHSDFIRYLTESTRETGEKSLKEMLKSLKK